MSDIAIKFDELTPEKLQKILEVTERLLLIGKGLSVLTPTKLDDQAIAFGQQFLEAVKPFADEPFVVELINFIVSLVKRGKGAEAVAVLSALSAEG